MVAVLGMVERHCYGCFQMVLEGERRDKKQRRLSWFDLI